MILESAIVAATNTDILSTGRLNAIPYNGTLTLQFLADLGNTTSHYLLTLQKPNGDVPIDNQIVPASGSGLDGVLDDRELLQVTFQATQGGHFTVSLTEVGTATVMWRAILKP